MKKSQIKKMIKENIKTGMSHLEAMESLQNEFPAYTMEIMSCATDIMMKEAFK